MPLTAFYAGLLGLLYVLLSVRVIGARRGAGVALGDGGDKTLLRRMRVHANFAEYVPLALLLIGLAESMKPAAWIIHALGVGLVAGRLLHAYGVSQTKEIFGFRVAGMAATFTVIVSAAIACIAMALRSGALG